MSKKVISNIPEVFTRAHDILYGVIEVLPQDADGKDLTKVTSFEKHVPAMRALCFNSPNMYKALNQIALIISKRRTKKEILLLVKKSIEAVKNSYKAYEPVQLGED